MPAAQKEIHKWLELFGEPTVAFISLIQNIYQGEPNSRKSEPPSLHNHILADVLIKQPKRKIIPNRFIKIHLLILKKIQ